MPLYLGEVLFHSRLEDIVLTCGYEIEKGGRDFIYSTADGRHIMGDASAFSPNCDA